MSVICQNFVQNAWKKDLCSNCFKSQSDHQPQFTISQSCAVESSKNCVLPQINARYVSQATTIYHSRGFLNHAAWKSLLSERQENGNFFGVENGFPKLVSLSTNELENKCQNNKLFTSIMKTRTKQQAVDSKIKMSVAFKEEEPFVIGYGGRDYESDENEWETNSDDGDFPLGSLDVTAEDRENTKMTKENTEFNSKNENLLKERVPSCQTNGKISNECRDHLKNELPLTKWDLVKNNNSDVVTKVDLNSQPNENSRRKLLNGISFLSPRKESTPRASVRPILREDHAKIKEIGEDKARCAPVITEDKKLEFCVKRNSTLVSEIEQCPHAIIDNVGIIHESVIVLIDSNDSQVESTVSEVPETTETKCSAKSSFLHCTNNEEMQFNAIYTPASNDLFVSEASSSSDDMSDESENAQDENVQKETVSGENSSRSVVKENAHNEQKKASEIGLTVKPPKPARSTVTKKEVKETNFKEQPGQINIQFADEQVAALSNENETKDSYLCHSSIYYAVSNPLNNCSESNNIYQEVGNQSKDRISKLAALAQELEQARYAGTCKRQAPSPPKSSDQFSGGPSSGPPSFCPIERASRSKDSCNSTKIYGFPFELKTKSATMSSVQGKKVSSILNFNDSGTPSNINKTKKGKFSIKKFLKRGKDMESIDQMFQNITPNPKAWKQAEFDRSKLKLEILHPMDLANRNSVSADESRQETSSLTDSDTNQDFVGNSEVTNDYIYDDELTWRLCADNAPINSQVERGQESLENSVDQSKTISPSSMTPNRTNVVDSTQKIYSQLNISRQGRPPKPPPPPRLRSVMTTNDFPKEKRPSVTNGDTPTVPVKPEVPKRLYKQNNLYDYANLGDIRSNLAPKKPERLSFSSCSEAYHEEINQYEPVGEYDSQLYQDTTELREEMLYSQPPNNIDSDETALYSAVGLKINSEKTASPPKKPEKNSHCEDTDRLILNVETACRYDENQSDDPKKDPPHYGGEKIDASAWFSLEQSYAIVSAANHEVLAKLLDQVIQQRISILQKTDGQSIQWTDFLLQSSHPVKVIGDKLIYNAVLNHIPQRKVTLVASLKSASPLIKDYLSKCLLGYFIDEVPETCFPSEYLPALTEKAHAIVYVLPKCEVNSIQSLFLGNSLEKNDVPVSIHEKDICFVLLQLIQALKILQAHGTEEVDLNVDNLILAKDNRDHMSNLVLLSADIPNKPNLRKITLCQCAIAFLNNVSSNRCVDLMKKDQTTIGTRTVFERVVNVLAQEKASSLSQAKQLLEYYLWGPKVGNSQSLNQVHKVEDALQRWLDIERAQSLRLLVRSHKNISLFEEHQLQFLVHTNALSLKNLACALNY